MKRRSNLRALVPAFVVTALASACSSSNFDDTSLPPGSDTSDEAGAASSADGGSDVSEASVISGGDAHQDPPPGCDGTKLPKDDSCVIDESLGIFVSHSLGSDGSGDGSRTKPYGTLGKAIAAASAAGKRVYACAESYGEAITLADGVSMFGNLACSKSWSLDATAHATVQSPTSPAMKATGLAKPTRVEGFNVVAPAGIAGAAASSIGFIASNVANLTLVDGSIHAAAGADGADGTPAVQLVQTSTSMNGVDAFAQHQCSGPIQQYCRKNALGGVGGKSVCSGAAGVNGGDGGQGAFGGRSQVQFGGTTGTQPVVIVVEPAGAVTPASATTAGANLAGANGSSGSTGASASTGTFSETGFAVGNGGAGQNGGPGQGGGGGNGVPAIVSGTLTFNDIYYGNAGAGGGAGGCPGLAGGPGTGGGASVGVISLNSTLTMTNVAVSSSAGGKGGKGSLPSDPTGGGSPGANTTGQSACSAGAGGRGGVAGASGSGAGGPSIGVVYKGTKPNLGSATPTVAAGGAGQAAQSKTSAGVSVTLAASPAGAAQAFLQIN